MNGAAAGMRHNFRNTDPEAYVGQLDGWRLDTVRTLREAVKAAGPLEERIKWGHLVFLRNGATICLIRAEGHRVLLGYFRGRQLTHLEPRLKPGGKYDLATADLREGDPSLLRVTELTRAALALEPEQEIPDA